MGATRPCIRRRVAALGEALSHAFRLGFLTLFPRRGFRRALSPRRRPSVQPLCLAPWRPPGPPPGSLGPPARPLQASQWDLRPTSNFSHSAGLQPAGFKRSSEKHSQTLNIDLSSSDRAHERLARSGRMAGGAAAAGACAEKVLAMILKAPGNVAISNEAADAA